MMRPSHVIAWRGRAAAGARRAPWLARRTAPGTYSEVAPGSLIPSAGAAVRPAFLLVILNLATAAVASAQNPMPATRSGGPSAVGLTAVPQFENPRIHELVAAVSVERVERDVRTLAAFGTRHTLSDTLSGTRGIGAARRWLHAEFERISAECGGCLEVRYISRVIPGGSHPRVPVDVEVVSPVAIQRGRVNPDHYVLMTAHYDSRVSDPNDWESDAPGANDDASGVAGVLEVARLLSRLPTDQTIVYAPLAGEEQALFGGNIVADHAVQNGWNVTGVLNNDMIGNTRGITGLVENTTVRVFAPGIMATATQAELQRYLSAGGELDGPSRQLARRVVQVADTYLPNLDVLMIYRLDRFGRGGDHTPFFTRGLPAVRITETHEDYRRQHQDLRTEGGVEYGDVPDVMDFPYLATVTSLNVAAIASLAWAPPAPSEVRIRGGVTPHTILSWSPVDSADLLGYRVHWRRPTEPLWTHSRWVGDVTTFTLENVVIDNFFFGVSAVDRDGNESLVVFPNQ
jgi:Zn-dependent M28 family amino/carboxypeptidase